jgi:hypothetical protein
VALLAVAFAVFAVAVLRIRSRIEAVSPASAAPADSSRSPETSAS